MILDEFRGGRLSIKDLFISQPTEDCIIKNSQTTTTSRMTKSRKGEFKSKKSAPELTGKSPSPIDPEIDADLGFDGLFEEVGVRPDPELLEGSGVTTDEPTAGRRPQLRKRGSLINRHLVREMRQTKAQLANAAAEVARLKDSIAALDRDPVATRELLTTTSTGARRPEVQGINTSALTETEKDANRRALLARCSDEFRRHDLTKVQSIPNPFSGAAGDDFDEFLVRFEVRANNCGWTDQDKVMGLVYHLDKGAALAYQRMIANGELAEATFIDAVALLRNKYPQASPSGDQQVAMFRNLRQRKGESVAEFAERFQTALARAERFQGAMTVAAIITRFRASLRGTLRAQLRQVKLEALGSQPLAGMIAEATHMETQLLQEGHESDAEDDDVPALSKRKRVQREDEFEDFDQRPQTAKRVVRAITAPEVPWQDASAVRPQVVVPRPMSDEMGQVLRQVKAVVETTQAVATRMQETQARDAEDRARFQRMPPPPPVIQHRDGPPIVCYKCGRLGHIARDCRAGGNDRGARNYNDRPNYGPGRYNPPAQRGAHHYAPYRQQPQRFDGNRGYGRPERPRADDRGERRDPPRDQLRDRPAAADQRPPRQFSEEDRRALARSAEILQGALQAAMVDGQAQNPVRPN